MKTKLIKTLAILLITSSLILGLISESKNDFKYLVEVSFLSFFIGIYLLIKTKKDYESK